MKFLSNMARIWWAELVNMFRDHGVVLFVIVVPLAYPLLYAFIYDNETVRDVPVAIVDNSKSALSRQFIRMLDASPEVAVYEHCNSVAEAEDLNRRGDVYGVVVIPSELESMLNRGEQAVIGVYADMAGMLYYKSLLLAATNVSLELGQQIKLERFYLGATDRQEAVAARPIAYSYVPLYNPQSGFAAFLMPPVLMLILQQTLMLGIGMVGGGFRERNGGHALPAKALFSSPLEILCGKTLAYFLLYMVLAAYMFVVVTKLFGLPQLGHAATFFALMVPFLLSCIFMAVTFSAFIYRREDCILLYVFMSVPLLFISGISWPGAAVPEFWQWVSVIFPSTFATNGYVRINTMGAGLSEISGEIVALWIQTAVYFLLALWFYSRSLRSISGGKAG